MLAIFCVHIAVEHQSYVFECFSKTHNFSERNYQPFNSIFRFRKSPDVSCDNEGVMQPFDLVFHRRKICPLRRVAIQETGCAPTRAQRTELARYPQVFPDWR